MRDPRTDPRPGDVLVKGDESRLVDEHVPYWPGGARSYMYAIGWVTIRSGERKACSLGEWCEWARDATVQHTAEETQ